MFLLDLQGHELVASVFNGAVPPQVCRSLCVCVCLNVVKLLEQHVLASEY